MDKRMWGGDIDLMRSVIKYALAESFNDGVRAAMTLANKFNGPAFGAARQMDALLRDPRAESEAESSRLAQAEEEARNMDAEWLAQACAPWFAITSLPAP
jgi:hypothetical protein